MNSQQMRDALAKRWPADQYVVIEEAPDSADRMGRKLDIVAVSCWRSRGHQIDGVEIKVSMGDWRKELANPAKADFWWHHCHRFWLAVPTDMAPKVRDQLPETWGLLAVDEASSRAVVPAPFHEPEPLAWCNVVGLLRASAGAGVNALARAREAGVAEGIERQRQQQERDPWGDTFHKGQLDRLLARVDAFREASDIDLNKAFSVDEARRYGQAVTLVRRHFARPQHVLQELGRVAANMEVQRKRIYELAADLAPLIGGAEQ